MSPSSSAAARTSDRAEPVLRLAGFGIAFADDVILDDLTLSLPPRGITTLLGPTGGGKSTLLRTICGLNDAHPSLRTWGDVHYEGRPLGHASRPALVAQNARLLTASVLENLLLHDPQRSQQTPREQRELTRDRLDRAGLSELTDRLDEPVVRLPLSLQRRLAIVRTAIAEPALLCVDEPTAELPTGEADALLALLVAQAQHRSVLVITHHQAHARTLDGSCVLIAGGRIVEQGATQTFFDNSQSDAGRTFVRTGSCHLPRLQTPAEALEPDVAPPSLSAAARAMLSSDVPSAHRGPNGFCWLLPGQLAGTPQPGLLRDVDDDLEALQRVGVNTLICLTPTAQLNRRERRQRSTGWCRLADR